MWLLAGLLAFAVIEWVLSSTANNCIDDSDVSDVDSDTQNNNVDDTDSKKIIKIKSTVTDRFFFLNPFQGISSRRVSSFHLLNFIRPTRFTILRWFWCVIVAALRFFHCVIVSGFWEIPNKILANRLNYSVYFGLTGYRLFEFVSQRHRQFHAWTSCCRIVHGFSASRSSNHCCNSFAWDSARGCRFCHSTACRWIKRDLLKSIWYLNFILNSKSIESDIWICYLTAYCFFLFIFVSISLSQWKKLLSFYQQVVF